MKALDLSFKDCRLKIDWDWSKYGFKDMPLLCVLDLIARSFTPENARNFTLEEAIKHTRFPLDQKQIDGVIEVLMDKNVLLDK